ncbi:MAG: alcohol dehydrogenase [Candidatus Rokubacteria bacterium RIFCSPLOWO2_02_FULL_68_19]|nr:MAG: alcohol dehydrogenase [Candidatus Rokubacteria bacterium RIFCSPLOWO2_02_FULL_68_19]
MKAKAAILFEVGQKLELRDVEVQPPQAGEVLVRMAAGGVCHSDLHVMTGHLVASLPAILGHEGSGIVADVGPGVTSVKPGDHVIPLWRLSCGTCEYCSDGRPALCPEGTQIRMTGRLLDGSTRFTLDGQEIKHFAGVSSFAEYSVIPARAVLKIPEDFPLDRAALLGCAVITGVGAVFNCARVRPGSSVAVFGAGGIGLNVIQGAAIAGAEKIIAVDILPNKLEFARQFGATHTINGSTANAVEQIRALTDGKGVEYAFEAIGLPATMRQAYDSLRKRGMAVVVGVTPMTAEVSVPVMSLVYEERILTGSVYGSSRPSIDIPKLIALYRTGKLKLDELLTRRYPFAQINEAYDALERGEVARSVVTF